MERADNKLTLVKLKLSIKLLTDLLMKKLKD